MIYTQRELLDEGFWNLFKIPVKAAKGLMSAGAEITKDLAPSIYHPASNAKNALKRYASALKQGFVKNAITTSRYDNDGSRFKPGYEKNIITPGITAEKLANILDLKSQGLQIVPKQGLKYTGVDPYDRSKLYKVRVQDSTGKQFWFEFNQYGQKTYDI